jgi:hypothetical protein
VSFPDGVFMVVVLRPQSVVVVVETCCFPSAEAESNMVNNNGIEKLQTKSLRL